MDATDLWRRWYETSTKTWSDMAGGVTNGSADPSGMYRQWFEGMQERMTAMMPGMNASSGDGAGTVDMMRRWSALSVDGMQKSGEMGRNAMEMLPRWMRMLEESQRNLVSGGAPPADPLQLATRWYNATSGPFSDFVGDLIEREEFLEPSSQFLQSYAGFYKIFKRNSEEHLKNLQLPTRSDVTRVAGLVVALEDKVDDIEAMLEDLGDASSSVTQASDSAASIGALEKRLDSVEDKLDRLLAALETSTRNGSAVPTNGSASAEATDAARRKAGEMGVDLATVEGTGTDGRVTVEDVRKKGES